jgi:hypothetical protein
MNLKEEKKERERRTYISKFEGLQALVRLQPREKLVQDHRETGQPNSQPTQKRTTKKKKEKGTYEKTSAG